MDGLFDRVTKMWITVRAWVKIFIKIAGICPKLLTRIIKHNKTYKTLIDGTTREVILVILFNPPNKIYAISTAKNKPVEYFGIS